MVNGAVGSAWSSIIETGAHAETLVAGTPSDDDTRALTVWDRFDLASLTKLFVATTALATADDGLDLDQPVRDVLEVGEGDEGAAITLRHLLTHTSGLPAASDRWRGDLRGEELLGAAVRSRLESAPGSMHRYSCLGYIAAGRVLEIRAGRALSDLVGDRVLRPLGAEATFSPRPEQSVATERQAHRGLVRGAVHDELAAAIGIPVGNAGLFGTARDVVLLGRMVVHEGESAAGRVLRPETARLLTTGLADGKGYRQAVGFRVGDRSFMACDNDIGHTGFTGTSLVIAPRSAGIAVLLTNRVHPTRVGADVGEARRSLARRLHAGAGRELCAGAEEGVRSGAEQGVRSGAGRGLRPGAGQELNPVPIRNCARVLGKS